MKISFWADDTLYKIFKTIEKLPNWKEVEIFIHPSNSVFENIWLWKQILDLLDSRWLNYYFVCKNKLCVNYYKKIWARYKFIESSKIKKFIKSLYSFFYWSKDFHKYVLKHKSSIWYLIIATELVFVVAIFYFFYMFVTPSAKVYIKPSYSIQDITYNFRYIPAENYDNYTDMNQLSIPYYELSENISYWVSMQVDSLRYSQEPSEWEVVIYNETSSEVSLVSNTRLVTSDWLIFRTKNWVSIPAAQWDEPWEVTVEVKADTEDESWEIIWDRWNILEWTSLLIINLSESYNARNIYAEAISDFTWGSTQEEWEVQESDIQAVIEYLEDYVNNNINSFAWNLLSDYPDKYLLRFSDFIDYEILDIQLNQEVGDYASRVDWNIEFNISAWYFYREDFDKAIWKYIQDRTSENYKLIDINKSSLTLFQAIETDWYYVIPTRIDTVRWYDFESDINSLKDEIAWMIMWEDIWNARNIILWYDEADVSIIRVTPPWYDNIPSVRSRIDIRIDSH